MDSTNAFDGFVLRGGNLLRQWDDKGFHTTKIADVTESGLRIVLIRSDYRFNQTFILAMRPEHDTSRVVAMIDPYGDLTIMPSASAQEQDLANRLMQEYIREMAMFKCIGSGLRQQ